MDKTCERCLQSCPHTAEHHMRHAPRVLIVHLKRFRHQALASGHRCAVDSSRMVHLHMLQHLSPT